MRTTKLSKFSNTHHGFKHFDN